MELSVGFQDLGFDQWNQKKNWCLELGNIRELIMMIDSQVLPTGKKSLGASIGRLQLDLDLVVLIIWALDVEDTYLGSQVAVLTI